MGAQHQKGFVFLKEPGRQEDSICLSYTSDESSFSVICNNMFWETEKGKKIVPEWNGIIGFLDFKVAFFKCCVLIVLMLRALLGHKMSSTGQRRGLRL